MVPADLANTMFCTQQHATKASERGRLICTLPRLIHCTALPCPALHCTALHCTAHRVVCHSANTIVSWAVTGLTELPDSAVQVTELYYSALHCKLHYTVLYLTEVQIKLHYCKLLYCITMHYSASCALSGCDSGSEPPLSLGCLWF